MGKMPKIPKNLTDKDMVKNYVEEQTIEDQLLKAAKKAEKLEQAAKLEAPPAHLARAGLTPDVGFTPEFAAQLSKNLLALKMELANSGVTSYNLKIKRDGETITLSVANKKF